MLYEFTCAGCGKKTSVAYRCGGPPKYCSVECREAAQKERDRKARKRFTQPPVPYRVCKKCRWGRCTNNSTSLLCTYSEYHDTSRTALHPEGLTADCKEFEPKRRKRNGTADI